jgi:hypothetical protein
MPFYPLPLSIRVGSWYKTTESHYKYVLIPIVSIVLFFTFPLDIISLPFRWIYHRYIHLCDVDDDEMEWSIYSN